MSAVCAGWITFYFLVRHFGVANLCFVFTSNNTLKQWTRLTPFRIIIARVLAWLTCSHTVSLDSDWFYEETLMMNDLFTSSLISANTISWEHREAKLFFFFLMTWGSVQLISTVFPAHSSRLSPPQKVRFQEGGKNIILSCLYQNFQLYLEPNSSLFHYLHSDMHTRFTSSWGYSNPPEEAGCVRGIQPQWMSGYANR